MGATTPSWKTGDPGGGRRYRGLDLCPPPATGAYPRLSVPAQPSLKRGVPRRCTAIATPCSSSGAVPRAYPRLPGKDRQPNGAGNPIDSIFSRVRLRTVANRRMRCRDNALYLVFTLLEWLSGNWGALNGGENLVTLVLEGWVFPGWLRLPRESGRMVQGLDDISKILTSALDFFSGYDIEDDPVPSEDAMSTQLFPLGRIVMTTNLRGQIQEANPEHWEEAL